MYDSVFLISCHKTDSFGCRDRTAVDKLTNRLTLLFFYSKYSGCSLVNVNTVLSILGLAVLYNISVNSGLTLTFSNDGDGDSSFTCVPCDLLLLL